MPLSRLREIDTPSPTHIPERTACSDRLARKTAYALGVFSLGLAVYAAARPGRDELISYFTQDDRQETTIEHQLENALHIDVRVDCVTETRRVFAKMVFDSYDKGVRGWNTTRDSTGPSKTIHLMQDICDNFIGFTSSLENNQPITYLQNEAVNIATHEAIHVSGVANEAAANCYAIQRSEITALSLGASPAEARETRRVAALLTSPTLYPKYQSDECRPGGAYDLGISPDGVFPDN